MAVRHLYETAFDSTASPADADTDPADILETSRRLFSPEPAASIQRPSPASSRSSSDSDRSTTRRGLNRSPGLPLKKIFSPWTCGKNIKETDTPVESLPSQSQAEPKEEKGKTFSPSVEFKKLDVADENKATSTTEPLPFTFHAKPRASTNIFCKENGPSEAIPSTTTHEDTNKTKLQMNFGKIDHGFENGDCSGTTTTFSPARASIKDEMRRNSFNNNAASRNNLWLDFSRAPKRPRRHLCLDINGLSNDADMDPTTQLMKQGLFIMSKKRSADEIDEGIDENPCKKYCSEEKTVCAICKDTDAPDPDTFLRCAHRFHADCITPWLQISRRCPLCKTVVIERAAKSDMYPYEDSDSLSDSDESDEWEDDENDLGWLALVGEVVSAAIDNIAWLIFDHGAAGSSSDSDSDDSE